MKERSVLGILGKEQFERRISGVGEHHQVGWVLSPPEQRITLDAVGIRPVRAGDGEQRIQRSSRGRDRAQTIRRRSIEKEIHRTATDLGARGEDHFETPVDRVRMLEKQLRCGSEVAGVHSCKINARTIF